MHPIRITPRKSRAIRARVAEAFRRLANGRDGKSAYAHTKRFYRAGGQAWARQLG